MLPTCAIGSFLIEIAFFSRAYSLCGCGCTTAWGVNLPAHFVIVKGTEYYDGKTNRYVDYPLTDVLQMIGRAGRPGFDDSGVAVVMVAQDKKSFYSVSTNNNQTNRCKLDRIGSDCSIGVDHKSSAHLHSTSSLLPSLVV